MAHDSSEARPATRWRRLARDLRLIVLGAWAGTLLSFSTMLVPALFSQLPAQWAAAVLGISFARIDRAGLCAASAVVLLALLGRSARPRWAHFATIALSVAGGIAHAWNAWSVAPRLGELRELAGGSIGQLPEGHPGLAEFAELHALSMSLFGAATLCALGAVVGESLFRTPRKVGK